MGIQIRVVSLRANGDHDEVQLPSVGVTCVVGGNNVGKSQLLREINARFTLGDKARALVLSDARLLRSDVSLEDVADYLEMHGVLQEGSPGESAQYAPPQGGSVLRAGDLYRYFQRQDGLRGAEGFFVWHASAGSLAGLASGSAPFGMGPGAGGSPLTRIFRNGDLESELSLLSTDSFGMPLTLDRIGGSVVLRVGRPCVDVPPA